MPFLIFILVLSILVIFHEFGHFWAAKMLKVRVEKFSLGFGKKILSFKNNHTEYSICFVLFGGFVKLAGDNLKEFKGRHYEYLSRSVWQRMMIVFFGPLLNYILAFLCFWMVFIFEPPLIPKVGGLLEGYPAKEAGLRIGDLIVSVDERDVKSWQQLQRIIFFTQKDTLNLRLERDNQSLRLSVPVKKEELKIDQSSEGKHKISLIGITPTGERYSMFSSFLMAGQNLFFLTRFTYDALWEMIIGKISIRESVTGPIGIFNITKDVSRLGILPLIDLMAILSMSLAIFNLLPLPILDGGHIFLLLIERLRGKRISPKTEEIISQVGTSLIIFLALLISYNDFLRFGYLQKIIGWIQNLFIIFRG